jgi:hypothetical protein
MSKKSTNRLFLAVFFSFLAFLGSCTSGEKKEVGEFLDGCAAALNNRDAQKFLDCYDPAYADAFFPPESAKKKIKEELSRNLAPSYQLLSREVQVKNVADIVNQEFKLEGVFGGRKRTYQEKEEIIVRRGPLGLRIYSGSAVYQILAGRAEEEDAITSVLEKRVKALKQRDIGLFKQIIDPEYDFKNKDFNRLVADMQDNFKNYDSIELELDRPRIRFYGDRAEAVEGYKLKVLYKAEKMEFNDNERLEFRKTPDGWKISKGI